MKRVPILILALLGAPLGGASWACSAGDSAPRSSSARGGGAGAGGSSSGGGTTTGTSTGGTTSGGNSGGGTGTSTGGTTSGGNSGGVGAGGMRPRDASSDVGFDWPEGTRDAGGQCKPGTYEGRFDCTFSQTYDAGAEAGVFSFPVSGPITLRLVQSQNGEFLEIKDGVLDGTANTFFTLKATISGKLDCRTGMFDGSLDNGTYSGFIFVNGTWSGRLTSIYDRINFKFPSGGWQMNPDIGGGCVGGGTWMASYVGP